MPIRNINTTTDKPGFSIRITNGVSETVPAVDTRVGYEHITSVTPGYILKKKLGQLTTRGLVWKRADYTFSRGSTSYKQGTFIASRSGVYDGWYGSVGVISDPDSSKVDPLAQRATVNLLNEVKGMKINLAQVFGERQQTLSLITGTAGKLAKSFLQLKSGNIVGAAKTLGVSTRKVNKVAFNRRYPKDPFQAAGNAWLEFQYGWKPLLQDVYGAAEHLARKELKLPRTRVTKSASQTYRTKHPAEFDSVYARKDISDVEDVTVSIGVVFRVTNPGIQEFASLGLSNPALLAWELLPFSFVVDWFLPIGNWVSTWDATLGCSFLDGWQKVKFNQNRTVKVTALGQVSPTETYTGSLSGGIVRKGVITTPLLDWPSANFPQFKNPVSPTHFWNSMALLAAAFRK